MVEANAYFLENQIDNDKLITYKFEGLYFLGPSNPKNYLDRQYGDWQILNMKPTHNYNLRKYVENIYRNIIFFIYFNNEL